MDTAPAILPHAVRPGRERSVWYLGSLLTFLATGEETGGAFALIEGRGRRGSSPPRHIHSEDESFYVIEGEITVSVGDRAITLTPGMFLTVPRGVPHTFVIESDEARMLTLFTPAGFEGYFREMGEPARALSLPPPPTGPPDVAKMVAIGAKYGGAVVGPPTAADAVPG
jgi:quercetin dioxygenase-like cupin family protein